MYDTPVRWGILSVRRRLQPLGHAASSPGLDPYTVALALIGFGISRAGG